MRHCYLWLSTQSAACLWTCATLILSGMGQRTRRVSLLCQSCLKARTQPLPRRPEPEGGSPNRSEGLVHAGGRGGRIRFWISGQRGECVLATKDRVPQQRHRDGQAADSDNRSKVRQIFFLSALSGSLIDLRRNRVISSVVTLRRSQLILLFQLRLSRLKPPSLPQTMTPTYPNCAIR